MRRSTHKKAGTELIRQSFLASFTSRTFVFYQNFKRDN